ncbi:hypothetical protein CDEF62S_04828 [Castellaniella defragrans]
MHSHELHSVFTRLRLIVARLQRGATSQGNAPSGDMTSVCVLSGSPLAAAEAAASPSAICRAAICKAFFRHESRCRVDQFRVQAILALAIRPIVRFKTADVDGLADEFGQIQPLGVVRQALDQLGKRARLAPPLPDT